MFFSTYSAEKFIFRYTKARICIFIRKKIGKQQNKTSKQARASKAKEGQKIPIRLTFL